MTADLRSDKELVNRGADVRVADRVGRAPVHFALLRTLDLVKYIQSRGADQLTSPLKITWGEPLYILLLSAVGST